MVQPGLPPLRGAIGEEGKKPRPAGTSARAPRRSLVLHGADQGPPDEAAELRGKLLERDELVQTLKQVVRAQHEKIEEFKARASAEGPPAPPASAPAPAAPLLHAHLQESARRELEQGAEERARLEAQVLRLSNQVRDLRASNRDLARTKERLAAMLAQVGQPPLTDPEPCDAHDGAPAPSAAAGTCAQRAGPHQVPQLALPAEPSGGGGGTPEPGSPRGSWQAGGRARFAHAVRTTLALWRAPSVPKGLLRDMLQGATEVVDAGGTTPAFAITLFIADPWLRGSMMTLEDAPADGGAPGDADADAPLQAHRQPHVFYLSGKVTVHAYRHRSSSARLEPPQFASLDALPFRRGRSLLVLPLQAAPGRPILGALQISPAPLRVPQRPQQPQQPATARAQTWAREEAASSSTPGDTPSGAAAHSQSARGAPDEPGAGGWQQATISAAQAEGLQLLCTTAAGIVDMHCRSEASRQLQSRARDCLSIAAAIHEARNLADFEMVVKTRVARFFSVALVRLLFYSPETKELLTTATRAQRLGAHSEGPRPAAVAGRRNLTRCSIQVGIAGRCLRKQKVFHLDPIFSSAYVHEQADGIGATGRQREANMLCGPLLAQSADDREHAIGVLQLIEKRIRADSEASFESAFHEETESNRGACDPFTPVDESFFADLLKIIGNAAWRTMQAQAHRLHGEKAESLMEEVSVDKLLTA